MRADVLKDSLVDAGIESSAGMGIDHLHARDDCRRRLKVRFRVIAEIKAALGKLQPGFRLLADLTELETMETDCAPALREIMHLCGKSGVSLVVRAIPDPRRDIGLGIMSYFHSGPTVQIATCTTLAEARGILAAKSRDEAAPDSPPND